MIEALDQMKADYEMSRSSRFVRRRTGVAASGSGADYHYRSESQYYADIEQMRDMDRNDPLVGILADRRVDNIVQQGFTLDPKTGDKKLDQDLFARWQDETTNPDLCDIAGEMTWLEIERFCSRAESVDGDSVVAGTQDGPFQVLESHSIQTKSKKEGTFLGVTTDRFKRRLKYWVLEEINAFGGKGDEAELDVRDSAGVRQVFHVYNPKRVYQTRGVSQMAPIVQMSAMLEDINFAKLVQQQVVSCFAIFRKLAAVQGGNPPSTVGYGDSSTETLNGGGVRQLEGVSPGMEIIGRAGEELDGFSPNVPNAEYFQQVRLMMQIMGVNFGLPLCLVLMDGSETNFSGWRGAVDEARKGFVADQLNLVRRLHKPAYEWKVSRWMESDPAFRKVAKNSKIKILAHNWNLPTWSYIEPVADAQGDAEQLKNSLTSPRRLHAARGKDWEEISEEIVDDNLYAIENAIKKAEEINKKFPTGPSITWRDLISLPMPANMSMSMQDPAAVKAQEEKAAAEAEAGKAGAEMVGVKRADWKNLRKAIKDLLTELTSGQISEKRARLELDSLGIPPAKIDEYLADAADGTVDTPEIVNG